MQNTRFKTDRKGDRNAKTRINTYIKQHLLRKYGINNIFDKEINLLDFSPINNSILGGALFPRKNNWD